MKKEKWRWAFLISIILLGLLLILSVRSILGPFILAFVLAYLLAPVVEALVRRGVGRKMSIAFVFIGILLTLALLIFIVIPKLYIELSKLTQVLPETIRTLEQAIQDFRANFRATGLPNQVVSVLDEHLGEGESFLIHWLEDFLDNLPKALTSMSLFILSPVIAIYLLADWNRLRVGFLRIVPQRKRVAWQRVVQDISHIVRSFIRGNVIVALIVGILSGVGVKLVGMDYALLIGVICGVFDLIPYFGPLIGAVPSVLLGLVESPMMALKVAVVILIVQQLESSIISPKLMGDSVGLHPLWIIFALLAGGEIAGFWGMLFSVPFAAVLRVIIRNIYFWLVSPEIKRES
ncbi:MAG TPA: AI-2E family transporter [Desulfitobacterium dehalogenans]|uniref:AI-2E family transporter n=1 Tax=Desulfitobacterium dehalogenans TaxID=36854 RepID=A0A7C7D9L3_9FIRM|nr:AI-2E family transporter [Desulfitobacterium dehalogenans]